MECASSVIIVLKMPMVMCCDSIALLVHVSPR